MNNYIKDITIDKNNNFITVYFLNNAYNIDGSYLTNKNFKLYIKDYFIYKEIAFDKVLKNNSDSYTIFFNIEDEYYTKNTRIFVELLNVISNSNSKINNIQNNNSVYLNIEFNTQDYIKNIHEISVTECEKTKNKVKSTSPHINYINKSSPALAYNNNRIEFYKNQISKYNDFYGKKVSKYPKSYYSTTYDKIFKPDP